MMPSQPLPTTSAASTTTITPRQRDAERLESLWRHLALQVASAVAHNGDYEVELTEEHLEVDEELRRRHPEQMNRWDDLIIWESTLIHAGGEAATCLTCRRARQQSTTRAGVPA